MDHHGSPGAGVPSIQHVLTNVTSDGRPLMEEDQAVIAGSLKHSWDAHGMSMGCQDSEEEVGLKWLVELT